MTDTTETNGRIGKTVDEFMRTLEDNLYYTSGQSVQGATHHDVYMALSHTVRDHLIEHWRKTVSARYAANPKFVYYLSAEYLLKTLEILGRSTALAEKQTHLLEHFTFPDLANEILHNLQPTEDLESRLKETKRER